jgi:hypothetical protein
MRRLKSNPFLASVLEKTLAATEQNSDFGTLLEA